MVARETESGFVTRDTEMLRSSQSPISTRKNRPALDLHHSHLFTLTDTHRHAQTHTDACVCKHKHVFAQMVTDKPQNEVEYTWERQAP